jgi:hypothetical protein
VSLPDPTIVDRPPEGVNVRLTPRQAIVRLLTTTAEVLAAAAAGMPLDREEHP